MKTKIIRFDSRSLKLYYNHTVKLSQGQVEIHIRKRQKPYLAIMEGKQIAACLWMEKETQDSNENDFSLITHPKFRRRGYADRLIKELVCEPINPIMRKVIRKYKFTPDFNEDEYWSFDL